MPVHLTARITWHDSANNGAICRDPLANVACRGHDWIAAWFADPKNAQREQKAATSEIADLGWRPPCWRDVGAFGAKGFVATHKDPLEGRGLPTVEEELPPYSLCPSPYRWMLEGHFEEICRDENLQIRGKPDAERHSTWVMEADRQKALLDHFWRKFEKGSSLVFFYYNQQNAVDDFSPRLLAGVARIRKVAPQLFFGFSPETPGNFPVWSRCVTHSWPDEGVRIP